MQTLSYIDREKILAIREQVFRRGQNRSDEEIVRAVSEALHDHAGRTGFEFCFTRYALELAYFMLYAEGRPVRDIARAALLYYLEQDDFFSDLGDAFGLEDDYYVLSIAILEIETRTGELSSYSGPQLNSVHREAITLQLCEFAERPANSDEDLISESSLIVTNLKPIASSGFFGRFVRSISRLIEIMSEENEEAIVWARAGLSYLVENEDVIPDELGLVGFLDDRLAVNEALRRCGQWNGAVISALDDVVGQWPFLLRTVFSDEGGDHELSEFILLNCSMLQHDEAVPNGVRWLSLPRTGLAPTALAMLSSIGHLADAEYMGNDWLSEDSKVHLDGNTRAVYLYLGVRTREGKEEFGLCHRAYPNGRPRAAVWFPTIPENFVRLSPAPRSRAIRGPQPTSIKHSTTPMRPIDRLLNTRMPIATHLSERTTVLISRPSSVRKWAMGVSLYGERLIDLLPMGYLGVDGDIKWFSKRWEGIDTPSILVIADPVDAVDWLEERESEASVVVDVDSLGHDKITDLVNLGHSDAPVLAISADADRDSLQYAKARGYEITGWHNSDLKDLILRSKPPKPGPLHAYETSVICAVSGKSEILNVECHEAEAAWLSLQKLEGTIGELQNNETSQMLSAGWRLLRTLSRWSFPLSTSTGLDEYTLQLCATLRSGKADFLSREIRDSAAHTADCLMSFAELLHNENPKYELLKQTADCSAVMAVAGRRVLNDALRANAECSDSLSLAIYDWRMLEAGSSEHVIVTGWYCAEVMNRLLDPPIASRVTILGYAFEHEGLERLRQRRNRRQFSRSLAGFSAEQIAIPENVPEMPVATMGESSVERFERLVRVQARIRAEQLASELEACDLVEAEFILFEDESHMWATEFTCLRRINHLLAEEASDDSELEDVHPHDLSVGDYLLFHMGSDSDAIRVQADSILSGTSDLRAVANLWRVAIDTFISNGGTPAILIERLHDAGCKRQASTVIAWTKRNDIIAPRAYKDIGAIAEATQDADLLHHVGECIDAVSSVRSAHMKASRMLATRVINALVERGHGDPTSVLDGDVDEVLRIVRVATIDRDKSEVPQRSVGNLIEIGEL